MGVHSNNIPNSGICRNIFICDFNIENNVSQDSETATKDFGTGCTPQHMMVRAHSWGNKIPLPGIPPPFKDTELDGCVIT